VTNDQVLRERLANQFLTGAPLKAPVDVVRALGAVQAQDYSGAKWAVGMRTRSATDADVEAAVARGDILRTHVLRPTWHFVSPEDIRWMLMLTGPRIANVMNVYNATLGLTPAVFRRSRAVMEKELSGGRHLTRAELAKAFSRARIPTAGGMRLARLVMQAEADAVVCSGPCRGKQFTYALLDERAPACPTIDRDEALSRLAKRYFATRGPASAHDFAWWSGLTVGDSKRAIEMLGATLTPVAVGDAKMWMVERAKPAPGCEQTAHLLPNYDEYFIGHRDRSAIGRRLKSIELVTGGDARISHVAVIGGQLVGGWKRVIAAGKVTAELRPVVKLTRTERDLLQSQRARLEAFLE
jgi:hypothetical protein